MKPLFASAAILVLASGAASAADATVVGDWLVKDGYANIRIDDCGGKMWGIVVWEKTPGLDTENPDSAKKARPTLGMPILLGLAPTPKEPGKWSGEIYNSQNGKIYQANISLADENTLDLEGCLVWPLCQTQKWTRVKNPPAGAPPLPPIKGASMPPMPPAKQAAAKKGAAPTAGPSDTCLRVADEAAAQEKASAKK
jgi:uncharacterized protein (DUF2147 family)